MESDSETIPNAIKWIPLSITAEYPEGMTFYNFLNELFIS